MTRKVLTKSQLLLFKAPQISTEDVKRSKFNGDVTGKTHKSGGIPPPGLNRVKIIQTI